MLNRQITSTLSQAALETLAIIAYKQPITRTEIEEIRGVKTERPLQTLMAKALIKEVGRAEGTGRAYLYGTTKEFLDYFGLKSIEELPPLPERLKKNLSRKKQIYFLRNFKKRLILNFLIHFIIYVKIEVIEIFKYFLLLIYVHVKCHERGWIYLLIKRL